jgi:hypothetical protein
MKKISNREEANNYYKVINTAVDDFISKTKARPSEVHKYLNKNGKSFLKRLEVDEIEGMQNILNDVLTHRKGMEDDNIFTFENFSKLNENLFNVGNPTVEHEKYLADMFNTSLGHIYIVDPQLHLFKINDFGKLVYSVVFSNTEILKIKEELKEEMVNDILSKTISLQFVSGVLVDKLSFNLSDFAKSTDVQEVVTSKLSKDFVLKYIESAILNQFGVLSVLNLNKSLSIQESDNFVVWTFNS